MDCRKPGIVHENSIKICHVRLYCDVIKWFENEDNLMNLIELVTTNF
jgi:hypothetical protein